jgi:hypothetical protein
MGGGWWGGWWVVWVVIGGEGGVGELFQEAFWLRFGFRIGPHNCRTHWAHSGITGYHAVHAARPELRTEAGAINGNNTMSDVGTVWSGGKGCW